MKTEGLCLNCVNKSDCIYAKNGPILFCEEFSDNVPVAVMNRVSGAKKSQPCSCESEEE